MPDEQALDLWHAAGLVLSRYPPPFAQGILTAPTGLPHGGGFSGAGIFRVELPGAACCLRAWPAGETAQQVAFRHHLMQQARCAGLSFVPGLIAPRQGTTVSACGRLWDLSEWMPGRADFWDDPTPARLEAACRALARLHGAWEGMGLPAAGPCPGIERRLALLERARNLPRGGGQPASVLEALRRPVERARGLLSRWLDSIAALLEPWQSRLWRLQPCLCDVWHDHLLFCGPELTGLIDYGAVKIDHVAVDLARLLGSLVEDDAEAWQVGLAAYRQTRPLGAEEEDLARALDRSGTILALANWVSRLREQAVTNVEGAVGRMERLMRRMERWG